jgi:hypothetical protein
MTRILAHLFLSIVVAGYVFAEPEDPLDIVETPDHITHYSRSAYEAGRRDAERDLREGRLIFEIYRGPPPPANGYPLRDHVLHDQNISTSINVRSR